jgi:membrane peptidoglycan carboxypeptidase
MMLQVRRLVPWTLLRVLTSILRARKGRSASSEGLRLANLAALEWTLKVEKQASSLHRAVERLGLSIWITRNWSAEELIAFHSEHVRLGHGVSGFWAGSWVYLGKDWRQLNAAEAALLVGIPQSPHRLDPWCHPERALARRNAVLRKMRELGFIPATEETTALAAPLRLAPRPARWRACAA